MARSLSALPKAHLHLHFTGSMNPATLRDLSDEHGIRLPSVLLAERGVRVLDPLRFAPDQRGWFRFQRLYDAARVCVRSESNMRRLLREAAMDDLAEGSRRLEIQIDPSSYGPYVGGLTPAVEIVLDEAQAASAELGLEIGVVLAASRTRHPLDARTIARLAAKYAGDGPGGVIGFGLSNDERRGDTEEFGPAFAIAARAGLLSVPHGGELHGPAHIEQVLHFLHPDRLGHGVRAAEDPRLLDRIVEEGIALEVCPTSNVSLGVYPTVREVPLRTLTDAGARVALGADDPLIFGNRLVAQYELARSVLGFTDVELAELARSSLLASQASPGVLAAALADVDAWLAD